MHFHKVTQKKNLSIKLKKIDMSAVGPTKHQEAQILIYFFFLGGDCKHRANYAVFTLL